MGPGIHPDDGGQGRRRLEAWGTIDGRAAAILVVAQTSAGLSLFAVDAAVLQAQAAACPGPRCRAQPDAQAGQA